jgi:quinol monooxygenase YgiN
MICIEFMAYMIAIRFKKIKRPFKLPSTRCFQLRRQKCPGGKGDFMKTLKIGFLFTVLIASALTGVKARANTENGIVVIGTIKVKLGDQNKFKAAGLDMVRASRQEAGNLSYQLVQGAKDPTEFATIEVWRSQSDIDKHMTSDHVKKFFSIVGSLFTPGYPRLNSYKKLLNQEK